MREGTRQMPGESKLSVAQAGLPPDLTVGALLAAAALAVVAQLVCHFRMA